MWEMRCSVFVFLCSQTSTDATANVQNLRAHLEVFEDARTHRFLRMHSFITEEEYRAEFNHQVQRYRDEGPETTGFGDPIPVQRSFSSPLLIH